MKKLIVTTFVVLTGSAIAPAAPQGAGSVIAKQKISETEGGLGAILDGGDEFGGASASLGDLDGDGVGDLAVGAFRDDDGGTDQGAVWVLFLDTDGTVKSHQKISETVGGFGGVLDPGDTFGVSVSSLGDLDGDGIVDLAVGAQEDDDGGPGNQGAVWILFLNPDGTVKAHQKISASAGGFGGTLDPTEVFGSSVSSLGDLDGDGLGDLAVGSPFFGTFGASQGAVWILFLNADGTVLAKQRISAMTGGFGAGLDSGDAFGWSAALLDDLDGDGVGELAVGAIRDDDGGFDQGADWILFLVGDTMPPDLDCPPSVTAIDRRGSAPGEVVLFFVAAFDEADPSPTVACVPPSGSLFPPGTTIVTCTATDASGNESVCTFPVVVQPLFRNEHP